MGQDAGDQAVPRNAQAACMEVSAMTRMASVYAPLDSLVPAASRVRRRGSQDLGRRGCPAEGGPFNHGIELGG